jgi:DNA-directed RNA polymerase specialized sigma24 family protein
MRSPVSPAHAPLESCATPGVAVTGEKSRWLRGEVQPLEPKLRAWLRARFPSVTDTNDPVQETNARLLRARQAGDIASPKG